MLAVSLVYAGLIAALLGAVTLVQPRAFLRIRSRRQAAFLLGLGVAVAVAGWTLPARETRVAVVRTHLDQFVPVYQFSEVHSVRVRAPRDRVYQAIQAVTADEILFFRTLTWIRRLGRPAPESILNAPGQLPLLEVATRTGFLLLAEEPGREVLVGTVVAVPPGFRAQKALTPELFMAIHQPGFAMAAMNFLVEDAGPGASVVTTQTRVYATDGTTRHRFAVYWRTIYPGSALIRRMWLRAVKRRAEAGL